MGAHLKTFRISLILLVSWLSTPQGVSAQAPQTPKPPVFGADVAVVAVPVFVIDKNGRAVGGLTADDFEVEDGGRKVPIVAFQAIDVDAPVTVETQAGLSALPISVQAEGPRQFLLLLDLEFSPAAGAFRGRASAAQVHSRATDGGGSGGGGHLESGRPARAHEFHRETTRRWRRALEGKGVLEYAWPRSPGSGRRFRNPRPLRRAIGRAGRGDQRASGPVDERRVRDARRRLPRRMRSISSADFRRFGAKAARLALGRLPRIRLEWRA